MSVYLILIGCTITSLRVINKIVLKVKCNELTMKAMTQVILDLMIQVMAPQLHNVNN